MKQREREGAETSPLSILTVGILGAEEMMKTNHKLTKVIHTIPVMTDTERDAAKKRIGGDLYEIFMRIQTELRLDMTMSEAA